MLFFSPEIVCVLQASLDISVIKLLFKINGSGNNQCYNGILFVYVGVAAAFC